MRRRSALLAVGALALPALVGCADDNDAGSDQSSQSDEVDRITVGVIPILDVAPIYLGKQKGFFSALNMELTLTLAQGGAAIVPAVIGGQFQFGFSNITSMLLAQSNNVPVKVVGNGVASTGVDGKDFSGIVVRADSSIRTAADLAGRSLAVNTLKNIADTASRASIRKAGGDPTKVKLVELGFPDMPAALADGRVDAIFAVEPTLATALKQGGRVIASSYVDAAPDLTVAVYFTSTKLMSDKPDLVRRFTGAITESLEYADTHPAEVRAIIGTYTQIPPDLIRTLTLPKWPAQINRPSVQHLSDLAVGDGLLSRTPDLTALMPSF